MKLRLHAGTINHWPDEDGWQNYHLDVSPRPIWDRTIDMGVLPDFIADLSDLGQFRAETFDEIRCHHVLEHLPIDRALEAIAGLARILKTGCVLDVETPDVAKVCKAWLHDELDMAGLSQWLLGEQLQNHEPSDSHRSVWTEDSLRDALGLAELISGDPIESGYACRFRAVKA